MEETTHDQLRTALLGGIPLEGEEAAVTAFVAALPTPRSTVLRKFKVAAATAVGALALTTGLAAADALPGAAQDVAADALEKVGVNVPDNHDDHADSRGKSAEHRNDGDKPAGSQSDGDHGKGKTISSIAHDPALEGVEKGAAVCTAASEAQCRAGQEHPGTTVAGEPEPENDAPGGAGQGGGQPDDPGAKGRSTADEHGGASPGGTENTGG